MVRNVLVKIYVSKGNGGVWGDGRKTKFENDKEIVGLCGALLFFSPEVD